MSNNLLLIRPACRKKIVFVSHCKHISGVLLIFAGKCTLLSNEAIVISDERIYDQYRRRGGGDWQMHRGKVVLILVLKYIAAV